MLDGHTRGANGRKVYLIMYIRTRYVHLETLQLSSATESAPIMKKSFFGTDIPCFPLPPHFGKQLVAGRALFFFCFNGHVHTPLRRVSAAWDRRQTQNPPTWIHSHFVAPGLVTSHHLTFLGGGEGGIVKGLMPSTSAATQSVSVSRLQSECENGAF